MPIFKVTMLSVGTKLNVRASRIEETTDEFVFISSTNEKMLSFRKDSVMVTQIES